MFTIFDNVRTNRQFAATTGLSKKQFDHLKIHYKKTEDNLFSDQLVKRELSEYLSNSEVRLFFILFFLKTYPTNDVLGVNFGMDGSTALRMIEKLAPILEHCLKEISALPARSFVDSQTMEKALAHCEQLLLDATERGVQRPVNQEKQKEVYSGKKKLHTLKNTVISNAKKVILFLGFSAPGGKYHDLTLLKKDFPEGEDWFKAFELIVDLGYVGLGNHYSVKNLKLPHKKKRKSKDNPSPVLSEEHKKENKKIGSERVPVENAIGGMKRYNFLVNRLRMKNLNLADKLVGICAGLWNFRLSIS